MFKKILVANRGEIACRVIRSCQALGVETVAVYSDADATALHVAMSNEAVRIGPAAVAESYLRADALIDAALATGAEAIHPGYGFLSENPDFVEAVERAGLVFIGPSADAIRKMGLKDAAKDLMAQAGVPVVPGYQGSNQDADHLAAEAGKVGYPVLIKAVAGGGGKGMRLAETAPEFLEALESARAEARTAFGNDTVLIEKFITNPRHIEVQIFGDGTSALHLFERDCSLQRRHQKVIEEAPAPGMSDEVRAAMGAAAVTAAETIGYAGAGTIEFIVDGSGPLRTDGFWFMEMNTRLQVEHPVTEAITGVDLVEWQLRVASGEGLPLLQDELSINGHAFEARLYAEDVPAGFLPATGRLEFLEFPETVRADSGVRQGDTISPWYDPMIAKVITHGPDRQTALSRLLVGLEDTKVAGTVTNLGFLAKLARHEGFARGDVDTGLIARDIDQLTVQKDLEPREIAQAAVLAAGLWDNAPPTAGFTIWGRLSRTVDLIVADDAIKVVLSVNDAQTLDVRVGDQTVECRKTAAGWRVDGARASAMHMNEATITLMPSGQVISIVDPLDRGNSDGPGGNSVLAPMPGLVTQVAAVAGAEVKQGDPLATLEAMKMEHVLRAPRDGEIAAVYVESSDQVEAGAVLVALVEEVSS